MKMEETEQGVDDDGDPLNGMSLPYLFGEEFEDDVFMEFKYLYRICDRIYCLYVNHQISKLQQCIFQFKRAFDVTKFLSHFNFLQIVSQIVKSEKRKRWRFE
jgi:hypothetical protein